MDSNQSNDWHKDTIEKLAFSAIKEQRATRRWSVFFKVLMFAYLATILYLYQPNIDLDSGANAAHTALVDLNGVIAADSEASADNIITGLREAFEDENSAGVILRINSPGGSPVQSGYINDEIGRLREEYSDKPFYVVITDVCASGGYYIAIGCHKPKQPIIHQVNRI